MENYSHKGLNLLKKSRARAYKKYLLWLAKNPKIAHDLKISISKYTPKLRTR